MNDPKDIATTLAPPNDGQFAREMIVMLNRNLAEVRSQYATACRVAKEWEGRKFDWPFEDLVLLHQNGYKHEDLRWMEEAEVESELLRFKQVTSRAPKTVKKGELDV